MELLSKELIVLGHVGVGGQKGFLYEIHGVAPCLPASQYKDPTKILVHDYIKLCTPNNNENLSTETDYKIIYLGNYYDYGTGFDGCVYGENGLCPTLKARNYKGPLKILSYEKSESTIKEVKVIGQMDNSLDHTFESANRVYDIYGIAPTIPTCGGGGIQPKILEIRKRKWKSEE